MGGWRSDYKKVHNCCVFVGSNQISWTKKENSLLQGQASSQKELLRNLVISTHKQLLLIAFPSSASPKPSQ